MDTQAKRGEQAGLYGEPVDALAARARALLGLDGPQLAQVIGVSPPMLASLVAGERVRLGNPVAIARLRSVRKLCAEVETGVATRDDVPLALAQIRASTTPASAGPPTASAGGGLLTAQSLSHARAVVARHVPVTPAYRWPMIEQATGTETWVKHENHTPTGAFKVRGGLTFVERLRAAGPLPPGLVSASRGNHAQSLAYAGRAAGLPVTIVVPEGNSPDKNAATTALGARLVIAGRDFQESVAVAEELAAAEGLLMVPSFHPWLVEGVATYAAELHEQAPGLDVVYVPVGMGSGIAAHIAVRDLLGARTEVVGVVADAAPAYALSFEASTVVPTERADTFVDGVACRTPDPQAVATICGGAARILRITEEAAAEAMGLLYRATHNLAEPAGALALAGLLSEKERVAGKRVAIVHTGGNCDLDVLTARVRA